MLVKLDFTNESGARAKPESRLIGNICQRQNNVDKFSAVQKWAQHNGNHSNSGKLRLFLSDLGKGSGECLKLFLEKENAAHVAAESVVNEANFEDLEEKVERIDYNFFQNEGQNTQIRNDVLDLT